MSYIEFKADLDGFQMQYNGDKSNVLNVQILYQSKIIFFSFVRAQSFDTQFN